VNQPKPLFEGMAVSESDWELMVLGLTQHHLATQSK
jgi:hypothetical protein